MEKTYYDPEMAPATNGICEEHNEPLVLIGRMSMFAPLEYVCPYCMNGVDKECNRAGNGPCGGEINIIFSEASGMALPMCNAHELDYYRRMDAIKQEYR
jgi:hypothetical protein